MQMAKRIWLIGTGLILVLVVVPILVTLPAIDPIFRLSGYGEIGDLIGGSTAPIVGLVGAYLLYLALSEQREANKIAREDSDFSSYLMLIELLEKKSNSVVIQRPQGTYIGHDAFGYIRRKINEKNEHFYSVFANNYKVIDPTLRLVLKEIEESQSERTKLRMARVFSGYFSELMNLILIVGPVKLNEQDHDYYINIRPYLIKQIGLVNKTQGYSTISINNIPPTLNDEPEDQNSGVLYSIN